MSVVKNDSTPKKELSKEIKSIEVEQIMDPVTTTHRGESETVKTSPNTPPRLDLAIKIYFIPGKELRYLPTEIWITILNMVADPNDYSHDRCTSHEFPQFIHEWSILNFSAVLDYRWQIGQLRLVCRAWSIVVRPMHTPYAHMTGFSSDSMLALSQGVVALSIRDCYKITDNSHQSPAIVGIFRNLNTLVINHTKPYDRFLPYLPPVLSNLRSFSYTAGHDLLPAFWKGLQAAFPNLIALKIRAVGSVSGSITLSKLEVLQLGIRNPPDCHFPRLRHFSSDHAAQSHPYDEFLRSHGQKIESLFLPQYVMDARLLFRDGFWENFPQLRSIGARGLALNYLPCPPMGHPFHHLHLYDQFTAWEDKGKDGTSRDACQATFKSLLQHFRFLRYVSAADDTADGFKRLEIKDATLRDLGMSRFSLTVYGAQLPEVAMKLMEKDAWPSMQHYPSSPGASYVCFWAFRYVNINSLLDGPERVITNQPS